MNAPPYPVTELNGFYYFVTPDGYRAATKADYQRQMAQDDVLPFGTVPADWAAWPQDLED